MDNLLVGASLTALAYLFGSFPTASAIGLMSGHDHSKEGSGNPGASNVYRTSGAAYGLLAVVIDVMKGFLPVLITLLATDRKWAAVAWVAATVGHVIPLGRFRHGGKGVATGGGGSLPLFPILGIGLILLFAVVVKLTKTASVGSLVITAGLIVGVLVLHDHRIELVAAVTVGALIIFRHRRNIERLVRGAELHV